jgi:hypothetical protein
LIFDTETFEETILMEEINVAYYSGPFKLPSLTTMIIFFADMPFVFLPFVPITPPQRLQYRAILTSIWNDWE